MPEAEAIAIEAGESIRTEISCKYDRETVDRLFAASGLEVVRWIQDEEDLFALMLARATEG